MGEKKMKVLEDETRTSLFLDAVAQITFALGELKGRLVMSERARRFFADVTYKCRVVDNELIFTALAWKDQHITLLIEGVVRKDGSVSIRCGPGGCPVEYPSIQAAMKTIKKFFEKCITIAT